MSSSPSFEISTIRGIVYNTQDDCIYFTQGHRILKLDQKNNKIVILFESKSSDVNDGDKDKDDFFGIDLFDNGRRLVVTNTMNATIQEFDLKTKTLKVLFKATSETDPLYSAIATDIKVVEGTSSAYVTFPFERKVAFIKDLLNGGGNNNNLISIIITGDNKGSLPFDFPFGIDIVGDVVYIADGKTVKIYDVTKNKIVGIRDGFSYATGVVSYFDENEKVACVFVFDRAENQIFSFTHGDSNGVSNVLRLAKISSENDDDGNSTFLMAKKVNKEIISSNNRLPSLKKKAKASAAAALRSLSLSPSNNNSDLFVKHNFSLFVSNGSTLNIFDRNALVPIKSVDLNSLSLTAVLTPSQQQQQPAPTTSTTDSSDQNDYDEKMSVSKSSSSSNNNLRRNLIRVSLFLIILITFFLVYYYFLIKN